MTSFSDVLAAAATHFQNNRLADAAKICEHVLGQSPDNSEALHLLGLVHFVGGNKGASVAYLRRAVAVAPANAPFWNNLGYICIGDGKFEEGVAACEQAVRLVPNFPDPYNNLGLAYEHLGLFQDADRCYRHAIALRPEFAEAYNNLGNLLFGQDKIEEAIAAYQHALSLKPAFPKALSNLGNALAARGDFKNAITSYRQAVQLQPNYHEAWTNLGFALQSQERVQEAVECFERVLRLQPGSADAHVNLGTVLEKQGKCQAAETHLRKALELQPGHAGASAHLAIRLGEQGQLDLAAKQWRETVRLAPDHGLAYFHLGELAANGHACLGPDELARLNDLVKSGKGSALDRSHYCFTLAAALDRQGRFDEAFSHYREANDLRKRLLQKQGRAFDARRLQAKVDHVIATYDEDFFRRANDWGADTQMPIIVVGMPRSGSTLAVQILSSDPQVCGAGESQEFPRLLATLADKERISLATQAVIRDQATARTLAASYLAGLSALGRGAVRVVDKTLGNFLHLGLLAALFPHAPIIQCRRDPRDLCISCYFQNFNDMNFSWSLEDLVDFHREYERTMAHWRKVLPSPIFDLQYEELVENQEVVTRRLTEFCNLSWDDRFLNFHHNQQAVQTASVFQVRKPLSAKSVGRWKNYQAHLKPLLDGLGPPV